MEVYTKNHGLQKSQESWCWEFRDSQLGSFVTKWHLGVGHVAFTKFGLWCVLWVCVCSWFFHAPKTFQLCTNQLVVWFVQIIDLLVTHPSPHPIALAHPSTLEVLRVRERTPTPYPSIVSPWTHNWVYQRAWGASQ